MEDIFKLFYRCSGGVSTDTRNIKNESLFISLKGDKFNGNEFASNAIKSGAKYAVVDEEEYADEPRNIFLVKNCLLFLQELANKHRKKFNIPVIGITGSNGKTSTKELMRSVLSKKYNVLATKGNLNNHIGVPLTLLEISEIHEIAIIEMGANKLNDIQELCEIAEPNHGVITNIGKAHLEGFVNFEGVIKTKTELYKSISDIQGTLIINSDDNVLVKNIPKRVKTINYGNTENGDVNGQLLQLNPYIKLIWENKGYRSPPIQTNMIGKYNFFNFLTAITTGVLFNVNNDLINEAISSYIPSNNRSQIKETGSNTLILDCYNANPTSMLSAIESFDIIKHESKIAIIGDMLELGKESELEHAKILEILNKFKIKYFTVGPIFEKSSLNESIQSFKTTLELNSHLNKNKLNSYLILLKGSRSIGLEKLVDCL